MEKSPVRSDAYFREWKPAFNTILQLMLGELRLTCNGRFSIGESILQIYIELTDLSSLGIFAWKSIHDDVGIAHRCPGCRGNHIIFGGNIFYTGTNGCDIFLSLLARSSSEI